jgi:hypothetical protein
VPNLAEMMRCTRCWSDSAAGGRSVSPSALQPDATDYDMNGVLLQDGRFTPPPMATTTTG